MPAKGLRIQDAESVLAHLRSHWAGLTDLRVLASHNELPIHLLAQTKPTSEGVFDPSTGSVFLIAENLADAERAVWVAAHEVVGHGGLHALGSNEVDAAIALAARNPFVSSLAGIIGADRHLGSIHALHEALAEVSAAITTNNFEELERRYNLSAPTAMRGGLSGIGARVTQSVKGFMAKMLGKTQESVSDHKIFHLVQRACKAISNKPLAPHPLGLAAASEGAPVFYSALQRTLPELQRIASKDGTIKKENILPWLNARQKEGKFKAEELGWSGIEEWLEFQPNKVRIDDLTGFVAQNGVRVDEVIKGGTGVNWVYDNDGGWDYREYTIQKISDTKYLLINPSKNRYRHSSLDEAMRAAEDQIRAGGELDNPARYSPYVLPGGSNYRELLLTVPTHASNKQSWIDRLNARFSAIMAEHDVPVHELPNEPRLEIERITREHDYVADSPTRTEYRSKHWQESNIVAHIRFNEHIDSNGKRVLFVEELQSDWSSDGKKRGFNVPDSEVLALQEKMNLLQSQLDTLVQERMVSHNISPGAAVTSLMNDNETYQRKRDIFERGSEMLHKFQSQAERGIEQGPYVRETKSWLTLAIKRIIRYAAEHDYDRVAFINGVQSAERYDLSQTVDHILYGKHDQGMFVAVYDKEGIPIYKDNMQDPDKLESVVGKVIADRILEDRGEKVDGFPDNYRRLSGDELKVGSGPMEAFYDRIVPQTVNDILKRLGGGKVEQIHFPKLEPVLTRTGNTKEKMLTGPVQQIGFDITPELRKKALAGLPLFSEANRAHAAKNYVDHHLQGSKENVVRRHPS